MAHRRLGLFREKCDALTAILCNFNGEKLENTFELKEVRLQLETMTCIYMLVTFFEARKAQIAVKSGELGIIKPSIFANRSAYI